MPKTAKAKPKARPRRLYFSAKISDYQFKKVLWHFVLDQSAAEAAKQITLSANSISAIYTKLRKFFFEVDVFRDIYKGGDPRDGIDTPDMERFEFNVLDFHLKRVAAKHGRLDSPMDEPDYHFSESYWRYGYARLMREQQPEAIPRMMFAHLMEMVRCCGPVGAPPVRLAEGKRLRQQHVDQQLAWLERNAARFRDPKYRAEIRAIRDSLGES